MSLFSPLRRWYHRSISAFRGCIHFLAGNITRPPKSTSCPNEHDDISVIKPDVAMKWSGIATHTVPCSTAIGAAVTVKRSTSTRYTWTPGSLQSAFTKYPQIICFSNPNVYWASSTSTRRMREPIDSWVFSEWYSTPNGPSDCSFQMGSSCEQVEWWGDIAMAGIYSLSQRKAFCRWHEPIEFTWSGDVMEIDGTASNRCEEWWVVVLSSTTVVWASGELNEMRTCCKLGVDFAGCNWVTVFFDFEIRGGGESGANPNVGS